MPNFRNETTSFLYKKLTEHVELRPQFLSSTLGQVVLNISEGCNLGCTYCFADRGHYGEVDSKWMTQEKAINSLKALLQKYERIGSIKFFGGEPFLNVDTIEAVCVFLEDEFIQGEIKSLPIFHVNTNLTVCNKRILSLINKFRISLTASIDGPKEIHDAFRMFENGSGSFEIVDKNIQIFREYTKQPSVLEVVYNPLHLEAGYTMIDVHTFLEDRYSDIRIIIHPMEPHLPASLLIKEKSWKNYRNAMYKMSLEYGQFVVQRALKNGKLFELAEYFKHMVEPIKKDAHCDIGVDTLTVGSEGKIYPCYTFIGHQEYEMAEDCTLEKLIDERFERVQNIFLDNKKSENPLCAKCSILKTCSHCPGEMLTQTGSINSVIPTTCNYLTGYTEGILMGLDSLKTYPEHWNTLLEILSEKR